MKKLLALTLLLTLILPGLPVQAATQGMVYDLALAGYRLGMSVDQADTVRPFQYFKQSPVERHLIGYVDNVRIDDVLMNVRVCFDNDGVYKVLARFAPANVAALTTTYQQLFGPYQDLSKTFRDKYGRDILQTNYRWSFPDCTVTIVTYTSNTEFATLSLVTTP